MNWLYSVIEKWLEARRKKNYIIGDYFRLADEIEEGMLPVQILKGPYKGTVFTITTLDIIDDRYGKVKFNHKIIVKQPGKHDSYYGIKFSEIVGNILVTVLAEAQNNFKSFRDEVLSDGEDRENFIEEPSEERTVPPQGSTASKE